MQGLEEAAAGDEGLSNAAAPAAASASDGKDAATLAAGVGLKDESGALP